MEYFSSCLWHLKDQYQCCNLAHSVLEQSQFAPETWIVLGNCFSLQKEHEIAIKFFTRATQISPSFAYAYTLKIMPKLQIAIAMLLIMMNATLMLGGVSDIFSSRSKIIMKQQSILKRH